MMMVSDAFPVFLKVEEAARILRISRTSAYEQANQWLASDGRVGLPVVRLGRSLRVPRKAIEDTLDQVAFPPGYGYSFSGSGFEEDSAAARQMLLEAAAGRWGAP